MFENAEQLRKYKNGIQELCEKFEPDYFVTLTFSNEKVSERYAQNSLKNYCAMVGREIFGRRSSKRLERLIFRERNGSKGIHYHLLLKKPRKMDQELFKKILSNKWKITRGYGYLTMDNNEWFKSVSNVAHLSQYLVKQLNQDVDDLLVADLCFYRKNIL
jgi:hypothetical protein